MDFAIVETFSMPILFRRLAPGRQLEKKLVMWDVSEQGFDGMMHFTARCAGGWSMVTINARNCRRRSFKEEAVVLVFFYSAGTIRCLDSQLFLPFLCSGPRIAFVTLRVCSTIHVACTFTHDSLAGLKSELT